MNCGLKLFVAAVILACLVVFFILWILFQDTLTFEMEMMEDADEFKDYADDLNSLLYIVKQNREKRNLHTVVINIE